MIKAIILGAGGHSKVLMDCLSFRQDLELIGFLDPQTEIHGTVIQGVPVLGGDEQLSNLAAQGVTHFFVGVGTAGSVKSQEIRERLFNAGLHAELKPLNVIHPRSVISAGANLEDGVQILAGAVISTGARLANNVIVNHQAIVEHDCVIGIHSHISTGAILCGGVIVGQKVHVGAGSVVRQSIRIGDSAIIGAGAVVVKDVQSGEVVVGNPARKLKNI